MAFQYTVCIVVVLLYGFIFFQTIFYACRFALSDQFQYIHTVKLINIALYILLYENTVNYWQKTWVGEENFWSTVEVLPLLLIFS